MPRIPGRHDAPDEERAPAEQHEAGVTPSDPPQQRTSAGDPLAAREAPAPGGPGGRPAPDGPGRADESTAGEQATTKMRTVAAERERPSDGEGSAPAGRPGSGDAPRAGEDPRATPSTPPAPEGATAAAPAGDRAADGEGTAPETTGAAVGGHTEADARPRLHRRTRMRRRLRYLRRLRELAFRDLGGLVFDLHRFGRERGDLVETKLEALAAIDRELRTLEDLLRDHRDFTDLREPGIAACPHCGTVHDSDANFCPGCGTPPGGPAGRQDATGAAGGAASAPQPPPGERSGAPAGQQPSTAGS